MDRRGWDGSEVYTLEELEACEPWLTLAELPAPQELERIIGLEDGVRD